MINRCPITKTRSNQSSRNCIRPGSNPTDISERIPVTGEDDKTYRNAFCAECHGIRKFTHWGLTVVCLDPAAKKRTDLANNSAYLGENCTWYLSPGNQSDLLASPCTRSTLCESVITTTESSKYVDLVNKCKAYSQLVEADHVLYKNFHCASCNGKDAKTFSIPPIQQNNKPSLSLFFDYKSLQRNSDGNIGNSCKIRQTSDENIQSYLTVIGLSLSITCLLAVVMTYIRFKALRTVSGLVLLALSLSLLVYQGLLLASPYVTSGTPGCKTVAILLHFMILKSFAWMTVISYDVSKTFSQNGWYGICSWQLFLISNNIYARYSEKNIYCTQQWAQPTSCNGLFSKPISWYKSVVINGLAASRLSKIYRLTCQFHRVAISVVKIRLVVTCKWQSLQLTSLILTHTCCNSMKLISLLQLVKVLLLIFMIILLDFWDILT